MQKLIVIVGPTASGKSDLAVKIANQIGGEVISADSRQVYKGLDIGTGKITKKEMWGAPHHLLDVASPNRRFSASDFKKLTDQVIVQIVSKKKVPIICGGTGFYIDALLGEKQIPEVPPNKKLRSELENKNTEELFAILKKLDSERAANIDAKNPRRLVRAIEICEALGKVPNPNEQLTKKYQVLKIGVAPLKKITHPHPSLTLREGAKEEGYILDEQELKNRINKRIDKWFKQGLLREVTNLHKKGLSWKRMSEIGLEYRIVGQYLQTLAKKNLGATDKKALYQKMIERMQTETWQYAKRQMTWFKKDKSIVWFASDKNQQLPIGLIEKEIKNFLKH